MADQIETQVDLLMTGVMKLVKAEALYRPGEFYANAIQELRNQIRAAFSGQSTTGLKGNTEALRLSRELLIPHQSDFHEVCEAASLELVYLHNSLEHEKSVQLDLAAILENARHLLPDGLGRLADAAIAKARTVA